MVTRAPEMTEKEWQALVLELASLNGWRAYHTFDSRRSAPGFPDLVLWRERIIYVELKKAGGALSKVQRQVIADLEHAGAEVYVWRPDDFQFAGEVLARRRAA